MLDPTPVVGPETPGPAMIATNGLIAPVLNWHAVHENLGMPPVVTKAHRGMLLPLTVYTRDRQRLNTSAARAGMVVDQWVIVHRIVGTQDLSVRWFHASNP
jgi:hypothetical protein